MTELKRTYYADGELKSEVFEINGKKEGELKIYYKNGQIMISCNYINGYINGEYKEYYENVL
jgi:antitoxin component YwqK of YwqJK toxin-antitoxin module